MCTQTPVGIFLSIEIPAGQSQDWVQQTIGMLSRVYLQAPCPRHWKTEDACDDRCEEEFPSPRIAEWTFTPADSLEQTADCLRSVKVWLPSLDDTVHTVVSSLTKHSVITFLSRLPSFGMLIVLDEHKEVCDFIMDFLHNVITSAIAAVDESPQAEEGVKPAVAPGAKSFICHDDIIDAKFWAAGNIFD